MEKVLITGGAGFIGRFVTDELLRRGHQIRVLDALRLIDISNNLGDAKSMVTHPATTTHRAMGPVEAIT